MADDSISEESVNVAKGDSNPEVTQLTANDSIMEEPFYVDRDGDDNTEEASYSLLQQELMGNENENDGLTGSDPTNKVQDGYVPNGDPNLHMNLHVGDDKTPQVGMVFKSYGEACYFYKQYAQRVGFAATVRRSSFKGNGECLHLILACCKWGNGREGEEYLSRPTAKTNCLASVKLRSRGEGLLHLEKVSLEHNHELNPSITQVYRCFKILSNNKVLRPKSSHNPLQPHENQKDSSIEKEHKISMGRQDIKLGKGDDEAIQQFFTQLQNKNSHFFYLIDLNEEGCLCNVFWADSRSRTAYKYYGDVISIDTTYLSGAFEIPLVLFLGVDHHGRSVLLGCGLLSGETIENYIWVFKAWVACMSGKLPNAMVTDHCKAIQGAVAEVFLGVRHRLCLYQIMEKVPVKLRELSTYKEIKKSLEITAYDSLKAEEFEENWREMIGRYKLEGCEWLSSLYKSRHSWAPVYLKDMFWAGLSTTQRTDSVTPFFDGFVNPKTSLRRFFSIYEAAMQSKYEKEAEADSDSFSGYWRMVSKFHMEEQLSKLYTLSIFKLFQDELKATMYCDVSLVKADTASTFEVKESVFFEDGKKTMNKDYEVVYYDDELKVQCICGSFQFRGILCKHALAVLKFQQVYEIPSHYILSRWRKDYKRLHALEHSYEDVVPKNLGERYDYLSMRCLQLLEVGLISDHKYQLTLKLIREVEKHLLDDSPQGDGHQKTLPTGCRSNGNREDLMLLQVGFSQGEQVHDSSQQGKRRGRPPKKRKEFETEAIARSNNGMEDVNQNDMSSGGHFRVPINRQHHIAGQPEIHRNMMQGQYSEQSIENQSRSSWLYHQIFQEPQIPRAHPGGNR